MQLLEEAKRRGDGAEEVSSKIAGEVEAMRRAELAARDAERDAREAAAAAAAQHRREVEARDKQIEELRFQAEGLRERLRKLEAAKAEAARSYKARLAQLATLASNKVSQRTCLELHSFPPGSRNSAIRPAT